MHSLFTPGPFPPSSVTTPRSNALASGTFPLTRNQKIEVEPCLWDFPDPSHVPCIIPGVTSTDGASEDSASDLTSTNSTMLIGSDAEDDKVSGNDFATRLSRYKYSQSKAGTTIPGKISERIPTAPATLSPMKRSASTSATPTIASAKRKKLSSAERIARRKADDANPVNNLSDSLRPGLMLVMVGVNPGLETGRTGHAYAHHSNSFWKLMHESGITERRHVPKETHDLMDLYSIGNTNLCTRPTRDAGGLKPLEMEEGVPILEEKVRRFRPEIVCIVGKGIWETIVKARARAAKQSGKKSNPNQALEWGWQAKRQWLGKEVDDAGVVTWEGARTFVATSTSGLAVYPKPPEKLRIWKLLGAEIVKMRHDRAIKVEDGSKVRDQDQAAQRQVLDRSWTDE